MSLSNAKRRSDNKGAGLLPNDATSTESPDYKTAARQMLESTTGVRLMSTTPDSIDHTWNMCLVSYASGDEYHGLGVDSLRLLIIDL